MRFGENIICPIKIIKSNTYRLTETGTLKYLLRTSGGISIPPVLAPILIIIASEVPMHRPPNNDARNMSFVRTKLPTSFCKNPRIVGNANVLIIVVSANSLPSSPKPMTNITALNIPTNREMVMPKW